MGFEWGAELPALSGERVNLRRLNENDAGAILGIFGDPEVMRYWSSPPLAGLEDAAAMIRRVLENERRQTLFQWGVALRDTDAVIGTCTLFNVDLVHRRAEIGYALGRESWGRGLATEAVTVLIRFAFETIGLHRLEADADPQNERSLRLLQKQGFVREGYLRERWHVSGATYDAVFLGLLRREWAGARS